MRAKRVLGLLGSVTLLCLVFLTPALAQKDSDQISGLLSQARTQAWQAAQDADTLQSYTLSPMAWQSHAERLSLIQEHVDALAKTTQQLNNLRSRGSQWQQIAIDRINPLLRDMNETLANTIKALNDFPERVNMPAYREYAHATYDVCNGAATAISDLVAYGKSRGTSASLREKLDLQPSAKQ